MLTGQLSGHDLDLSLGDIAEGSRHFGTEVADQRQRGPHAEIEPAAFDGQVGDFFGHFRHSRVSRRGAINGPLWEE